MYSQPSRIEYLDSIRGIAAICVLLFHSLIFQWPNEFVVFTNIPGINVAFNGGSAVAMFFVLSGFVLSRPYLQSGKSRRIFLPTFYLRRLTRIWLPWFFVFCFSAGFIRFFFKDFDTIPAYGLSDLRASWHLPLTITGALRQMALLNLYVPDNVPHLIPQDWSLGIELKASLIIPFFVWCARSRTVLPIALLMALTMIFSRHGYLVSFLLGVGLARNCDQITARISALPKWLFWIVFWFGVLLCQTSHIVNDMLRLPADPNRYLWCFTSMGCVLILISVLASPGLQRILQHRVFRFLGKVSYSIYLLHMLVLICVQPFIVHSLNSIGITQAVVLLPVSLGANIACTIAAAAFVYRFIEIPAIELGHWLTIQVQSRFSKN